MQLKLLSLPVLCLSTAITPPDIRKSPSHSSSHLVVPGSTLLRSLGEVQSGAIELGDRFCEGNSAWLVDYSILREGYDFSVQLRSKIAWLCEDDTHKFASERRALVERIQYLESNVRLHILYQDPDILDVLSDPPSVVGGLIDRYEAIESLMQASEIVWLTRDSQSPEEIKFRSSVAMFIADHPYQFESEFAWIKEYCYADKLPISLFRVDTRDRGADYGSNMEMFKILKAVGVIDASFREVVDGIIGYIYDNKSRIKKHWEALLAVTALEDAAEGFMHSGESKTELMSKFRDSYKYFREHGDALYV